MENIIKGRVWIVKDSQGKMIDDIDTDMIYHNAHLAITDINLMGQYAFGNLEGWEDFHKKAKPGDILIVGKNFGAGSSRQQAVDCFKNLGISLIIGESFGAIYKRNAINSAFPLLICENIGNSEIKSGDIIEVDLATGKILDSEGNLIIEAQPMSNVQRDILSAGGLFEYGKTLDLN